MKLKFPFRYILLGGIFFIFDRILKWLAVSKFEGSHLMNKYFGWETFYNTGVAFGIPAPKAVVIILTVFIIFLVVLFYFQHSKTEVAKQNNLVKLGLVMILAGALSNLIDRLLFEYTIDYIKIFQGVINLADIFIVLGFVIYFSSLSKEEK